MTAKEWVKANAKEGANLAEFENLLESENPVLSIKTKEEALEFIEKTQFFKSALDAETSRRIEKALNRFESEKLPEIIKSKEEQLRKELSPEETPEQKRLRELEEKLAAADARERENALKADLRKKAKELGMDPLKADRYAVYGDKAAKYLEEDWADIKTTIDTSLDKEIKARYKTGEPKAAEGKEEGKRMTREDFSTLSPKQQMEFVNSGGVTVDTAE